MNMEKVRVKTYYKKAAKHGKSNAMLNLGVLYINGKGVEKKINRKQLNISKKQQILEIEMRQIIGKK